MSDGREHLDSDGVMGRFIRFFLEQKLVVLILVALVVLGGIAVAPFDWQIEWLPRDPVPVDAIPNLGENQQIVFTEWPGRSPQDIEDQVTYPLTTALMGVQNVREVRSLSMFGFSSVYVIFRDGMDFYEARSRLLEKLSSLPEGLLPEGVRPALGPDATAVGQIFWYTLEGRDPAGNPIGGWDLQELRSLQDWYVRYGLLSAEGIAEVASVGGHVAEYQVDVDPSAMLAHEVTLDQVTWAVREANLDVGAGTTEINRVEYVIRGRGFIRALEDIEAAVVRLGEDHVPIRVRDVAQVVRGPGERRGALTVAGADAVGGVVVVREGYNPLAAITNVKQRIDEISPGLPAKAIVDWSRTDRARVEAFGAAMGFEAFASPGLNQEGWVAFLRATKQEDWPEWVTLSQVTIVPFYDRTGLIYETLGTLNDALVQQILVTVIVVIVMVLHLRASLVISSMLPLAVLIGFIMMKLLRVDSNLVSLAGIAIAIGTIVDMGLIISENVLKHLEDADPKESRLEVVYRGTREVGSAVVTAIATTVISFLPVFMLVGSDARLYSPLAYTKTFVLIAAVLVALVVVPSAVHLLIASRVEGRRMKQVALVGLLAVAFLALGLALIKGWWLVVAAAAVLVGVGVYHLLREQLPEMVQRYSRWVVNALAAVLVAGVLSAPTVWEPLGPAAGVLRNFLFVVLLIGGVLAFFSLVLWGYESILRFCLDFKAVFLAVPVLLILLGLNVFMGFGTIFGFIPGAAERVGMDRQRITGTRAWQWAYHEFPGVAYESRPRLDEGSFLWMPTTMPHASFGEALEVLQYQDMAFAAIPEIDTVVGKIGRAESALDPAPVNMIETVINYKPEYKTDDAGRRINFRYDRRGGEFVRDEHGELIEDRWGRPYRQWRDHIRSWRDIWNEIEQAAAIPGTTGAGPGGPIYIRETMVQTGMRADMGLKIRGPDLEALDRMTLRIADILGRVPQVNSASINADRVVGKPYLEIVPDETAIARYGVSRAELMEVIAVAIGGETVTRTVEGRERYPVRVRYPRELRQDIEQMERVLVATMDGGQVPLGQVARIDYVRGPSEIKSENTFLTAYITFGGRPGFGDVAVIEGVLAYLEAMRNSGELVVPAGVSWRPAGMYEQHVRSMDRLMWVVPLSLAIIFLILYFQFRSMITSGIIFIGIAVAWAGGFVMIYLYGQDWFANFAVFGVNMRELFQLHAINLSVAVWVGFLALFGIAVDDGVLMSTYLKQRFGERAMRTVEEVRRETIYAAKRRARPALMTSATTILALLPILTSTGRGSDLMIPMAIPTVGGMTLAVLTMFTVPVLYCLAQELKLKYTRNP